MMAKSRKWSKEDFENTFEAFLKTSLSSEDDTEKIKEILDKPVAAKRKDVSAASLWWANDDSDEERLKNNESLGKSKSFLKLKKSESPARPKNGSSDSRGRASDLTFSSGDVEPVITTSTPKQVAAPRKSLRKDKHKAKRETSPGKTRNSKSKIDTSMSKDSLEDISEKSEEHDHNNERGMRGENNVISVHDSSIDTSASYEGVPSNRSKDPIGFDTLDEMVDKQEFFQNLENNADGTVDYGRLNQELSQTGTAMISPGTRKLLANASVVSGDSVPGTPAKNPLADVTTDSSQQKPSMLSKVALMDSMDSTLNTTTSPKVANSRDTTQENLGATLPDTLKTQGTQGLSGHMGTNTSKEMEDLQRVLKEADMSPTIYSGDSRPPTGKANSNQATPVHQRKDVDRSVGDIIREMDAIHQKGREIELKEDRIHLKSDYTSPRSPRSPGLKRQSHLDDNGGFDHSHTDDTEVYQPVTAVGRWRMKKSVKERKTSSKKSESGSVNVRSSSMKAPSEERAQTARERFSHVQSSGYGQSTSPTVKKSRSRSAGKSPTRKPTNHTHGQRNGKGPVSRNDIRNETFCSEGHQTVDTTQDLYLQQSLETFAQHIKTRYENESKQATYQATSDLLKQVPGREREAALLEEMRDVREQWNTERTLKVKLQAELTAQEKDFRKQLDSQKLKYVEEAFNLKQENFVLVAKLKELENQSKGNDTERTGESIEDGGGDKGQVSRLEKTIQEQESLLAGYQAENKRLYEEMKALQRQSKTTEASMFKENQRLTTELSNVRQELELKNTELQNKGIITSVAVQQQIAAGNVEAALGSSRISHLEGELTEAKRVQESQSREIRNLQQNKFELEKHVENLSKEREGLVKELGQTLKPEQVKELELKHKEELQKLQDKIRWYMENQELLDKSNGKLRAKDEEIHRLKLRLEDFKSEAGRKLEENKIRSKEKAADAKKIQDLERQIKEMEQVIRRRHPNSLPAMMMVAASVPDAAVDGSQVKGRSVQVLETRIKKLEKQLEDKDDMAQQDVRAVEQKYNHIKLQFEERIRDLEMQLSFYQVSGPDGQCKTHPHSHALAMERELESVRERSKKQILDMQNEINRLNTELNKLQKNQENLMRNENKQMESEWRQQIKSLQKELKDREHDIQMLHHTVEKMRGRTDSTRKKGSGQTPRTNGADWPVYPHAPSTSREYQPNHFADNDMSELLQENHQLKLKLEQSQLELDQQRVDLRRSLAETESVARQNKERLENQIEELRSSHQQELQRVLADQALRSSTSRVAELQNRCETQEVRIRHLQAQLKKALAEAELVKQLKTKEAELASRNEELLAKVKDMKNVQAPEMRHFESLEDKLTSLAERQRKREMDLDSMVKQNQHTCRAGMEEEVTKWKKVVEAKNQQLEMFRAELDSILEVLKTLQRQGVTLPVSAIYS